MRLPLPRLSVGIYFPETNASLPETANQPADIETFTLPVLGVTQRNSFCPIGHRFTHIRPSSSSRSPLLLLDLKMIAATPGVFGRRNPRVT